MRSSSLAWVCFVGLAGCGSSGGVRAGGDGGAGGAAGVGGMLPFDCGEPEPINCPETPPSTIDAERPAQVVVPSDYTTSTRYPLVITLHARDTAPQTSAIYLGAPERIDVRQFVLMVPKGTVDTEGRLAWAASGFDSDSYLRLRATSGMRRPKSHFGRCKRGPTRLNSRTSRETCGSTGSSLAQDRSSLGSRRAVRRGLARSSFHPWRRSSLRCLSAASRGRA